MQEQQADVVVPAENHILALTLTPDKAEYKPGEHAIFTLHAVGADGRPVNQGEISLGVVDAALLAMQADLTPDIRNYFYGYQIPFEISKSDSTQNIPMLVSSPSDGFDLIPYETHVPYPEGMGWVRDRIAYNGEISACPAIPPTTRHASLTRPSWRKQLSAWRLRRRRLGGEMIGGGALRRRARRF